MLVSVLPGCSDSSSSSTGNQVVLPDDSPIPETPIREDARDRDTPEDFGRYRFWAQGPDSQERGLFATPAENNTTNTVDTDLLAELPIQAIPTLVEENEDTRLSPGAVFYRSENRFKLADTNRDTNSSLQSVSDLQDAEDTCLVEWAHDLTNQDNTSVAYHTQRDGNGCLDRSSVTDGWKQVRLGDDGSTTPQPFPPDVTPVAGPNKRESGENAQWLALDQDNGIPVRIAASDPGNPESITPNLSTPVEELHLIGRMGPDAAILAYTNDPASDDDRNYQLAYYDRDNNAIEELDSLGGDPELKNLPRIPLQDWITPGPDAVFFGIGNALVKVDSNGYRIIDSVDGAGRPYFVSRSDSHVVWGVLNADRDESPRREIRVVTHNGTGARTLVRAPYLETGVRGTADGWFYFTAARGTRDDGRLRDAFAIGYTPSLSGDGNAFLIAEAQWIGSSVDPTRTAAPQALASAPITDLYYRGGGSGMTGIRALEDPAEPLATDQGEPVLANIQLGQLDTSNPGATGVFMGPGFGRQRLLTTVEVGPGESLAGETVLEVSPNRDLTNRVHWLDPDTSGSLEPKGSSGPLVRHVPLF